MKVETQILENIKNSFQIPETKDIDGLDYHELEEAFEKGKVDITQIYKCKSGALYMCLPVGWARLGT